MRFRGPANNTDFPDTTWEKSKDYVACPHRVVRLQGAEHFLNRTSQLDYRTYCAWG